MSTGRTIALIKALGSGGGGGGGGSEEQFAKVYETTLSAASSFIPIASSDMNGTYVDTVVCMENSSTLASATDVEIAFASDDEGEYDFWDIYASIGSGSNWSLVASTMSVGGLLKWSKTVLDANITTDEGFASPSSIAYPTAEISGVSYIGLFTETSIPAGTTITVYARKKVA